MIKVGYYLNLILTNEFSKKIPNLIYLQLI